MQQPKIAQGALWFADQAIVLRHVTKVNWEPAGSHGAYRIMLVVRNGSTVGPLLDSLDETLQWVVEVMEAIHRD